MIDASLSSDDTLESPRIRTTRDAPQLSGCEDGEGCVLRILKQLNADVSKLGLARRIELVGIFFRPCSDCPIWVKPILILLLPLVFLGRDKWK